MMKNSDGLTYNSNDRTLQKKSSETMQCREILLRPNLDSGNAAGK